MIPSLLLISSLLAADPCASIPGPTALLGGDLRLTLTAPAPTDPLSGTPWAGTDLRLGVSSTDLLKALVTSSFSGATALDRTNVVTDNSTGKPILKKGKKQYKAMAGVSEIRQGEGAFLIRSQLQIDADGSTDSTTVDPEHGQVQTSLKWKDAEGKLHSFDTFTVPFFVLPYAWYKDHGVQLGDVAAVMYGDRVEYAVFADVGPWQKLGEGSIALHDNLGNNPWTRSGKPWNGIEVAPGVTMVVFPGTRDEIFPTPAGQEKKDSVVYGAPDQDRVREVGQKHLEALVGSAVQVEPRTTPHPRP